jgi:hypothetical protein
MFILCYLDIYQGHGHGAEKKSAPWHMLALDELLTTIALLKLMIKKIFLRFKSISKAAIPSQKMVVGKLPFC